PRGIEIEAAMPLERLVAAEEDLERLLRPRARPFSTIADSDITVVLACGDESGGMRIIRRGVALHGLEILRIHFQFEEWQPGACRLLGRVGIGLLPTTQRPRENQKCGDNPAAPYTTERYRLATVA